MEPLFKFAPDKTKEQKKRDVIKVAVISVGAIIVFGVFGGLSHLAEEPLDLAADATASPTPVVFDQCGNISQGLAKHFILAQKALGNIRDGATGGADKIVLQKASNEVEKIQDTKTMQKCREAEKDEAATIEAGINAVKAAAGSATKENAKSYLDPIIEAAALR
jgi:hypothetical protein